VLRLRIRRRDGARRHQRTQTAQVKLELEKYTLPNGLEVILHEDHQLPLVAVNIWYQHGSRQ